METPWLVTASASEKLLVVEIPRAATSAAELFADATQHSFVVLNMIIF
jgi:hypothetical protein